jgi:hypothetical protein
MLDLNHRRTDWPLGRRNALRSYALLLLLTTLAALGAAAVPRTEPTVEELKSRVSSANVGERPRLCVEIAQKQLNATDKLYQTDDVAKAQAALTDVVAFSELARDYAIQSHKRQKETEIAVRVMARRLSDMLHLLGHEEQVPVRNAVNRLQRVRDDLLMAMFPQGGR